MAQTSLLGWANSIRLTMASDPGRKFFQEQVQIHGFSFLDDYLDNILSGAKQDPLIELVKTPGRKKAISRKPKLASKLAQVVTMSLEEDSIEHTMKENIPPINSFTEALLSAKQDPQVPVPPEQQPATVNPQAVLVEQICSDDGSRESAVQDHLVVSAHIQPELSVIAEDDEAMDLSGAFVQAARKLLPSNDMQSQVPPVQVDVVVQNTPHNTMPSSVQRPLSENSVPSDLTLSMDTSHAVPVESIRAATPSPNKETPPSADISVPLRDPEVDLPSLKPTAHKSVLSTLPTLPEPIPLRKSMRATKDPSTSNAILGAVTPGNTGAGKRTSWLMKAREAKAMVGIPKKSIVNNISSATPGLAGMKRKSQETTDSSDLANEERLSKAMKIKKEETIPAKIVSPNLAESQSDASTEVLERLSEDGMLDMLKKKVQGLEARTEKLNNKAYGNAAAALAEARAQAEARIAERNHKTDGPAVGDVGNATESATQAPPTTEPPKDPERRFSVSDLFPMEGKIRDKSKSPEKGPAPQAQHSILDPLSVQANTGRESTSTTPPHSPPARSSNYMPQIAPVFNKPPPVFVPPVPSSRPLPMPPSFKDASFNLPPLSTFTKPASITLGISPRLVSPLTNSKAAPLSAQSTMETVQSDDFFAERGNTEAWVPSTQGTEYSSLFGSQQIVSDHQNALDDDDSWPIDEKLSQGVHWPFSGVSKEDSMTWSTLPSQSQRIDTGVCSKGSKDHEGGQIRMAEKDTMSSGLVEDMDIEQEDYNTGIKATGQDPELEELILSAAKSHVASVGSGIGHGPPSPASSASSQSQVGLFGQASKFLSSALGTSKKSKPEVKKVMQMAAVAAKKQQQEDDKKAARLKEMENRRQLAVQRKAEEEKVKQQEQERKAKEEIERRKREREEQGEKKPLRQIAASTSLKKDEEFTKKRKLEQDKPEKKQDFKKQAPLNKTGFKPTSSKPATALSSSTTYNTSLFQATASTSTMKPGEKISKVPTAIPTKGKIKPSPKTPVQADEEHVQPAQIIQTQMAARAKAAMQIEPPVPSESIELPEVNSEYSDSEDEDRPRTFNPPEWAQSPELRQALEAQSTINPDDIFGAIRPLRMEEMFKARASRFRARTSSANWSGTDRLTVEEEREYARRMGFK